MRRHLISVLGIALAGSVFLIAASSESPRVEAVVLGIAQDGGVPHIGCRQEFCERFRRDTRKRPLIASLGLLDSTASQRFIIDATPDFAAQAEILSRGQPASDRRKPIDGVLLTHAHIGHYAGLMWLGREALGADQVPVFATPRFSDFLKTNGPWSQLVALNQIEIHPIEVGSEFRLTPSLVARAFTVPHRDEFSDTVGFEIAGPSKRLLYIPDIDKWEKWGEPLERAVARVDYAFLDATFSSASEIPGRSTNDIPHPLVDETLALLPPALRSRVVFIHLNHTNPLLWDERARRKIELTGARISKAGMRFPL